MLFFINVLVARNYKILYLPSNVFFKYTIRTEYAVLKKHLQNNR
jgi:hypothetical protein